MVTPSYEGVSVTAEGGSEEDVLVVYNKEGEYVTKGQSPITIEGLSSGTTYSAGDFKVTYRNSAKESQPVDVPSFKTKSIPVNSIVLNTTEASFWDRRFSSHQLNATVYPINATNKQVVYSIEKPVEGLDVTNDGLIYISDKLIPGKYKIKVSTFDNRMPVFCEITLKQSIFNWTVDLKNKVSGSLIENPNIVKQGGGTTVFLPDSRLLGEVVAGYRNLESLGGQPMTINNTNNNMMQQIVIYYDIVTELERKLGIGIWQGKTSFSDKINIAKQIISNLATSTYTRGSSPLGNKVTLSRFNSSTGAWVTVGTNDTANIISLPSTVTIQTQIDASLDNLGMHAHMLYAEPSNGTVASSVSVDYTSLTITVDLSKQVTLPKTLMIG